MRGGHFVRNDLPHLPPTLGKFSEKKNSKKSFLKKKILKKKFRKKNSEKIRKKIHPKMAVAWAVGRTT